MKIMRISAVAAVLIGALTPGAIAAQAEVTANGGFLSQYYYRGIPQKESSANGGLDVASGMFSAGTWAADVGDGAEIDLYAGVGFDLTETVSLSIGGTGYFYTGDDFDVTYLEGNLGLSAGPVSLEWSAGQHDIDNPVFGASKYSFLGITVEQNGLFATVGTIAEAESFGDAFSDMFKFKAEDVSETSTGLHGQYLEAGYGFTVAEIDMAISGIWSDSELANQYSESDEAFSDEITLVFAISKTFDLSGM
jgi:uncharacterized protein (TIGR02001 family)